MKYLTISLLVFLFSCKASEKETLVGVQGKNVEFIILKEGTNSGFKDNRFYLITEQVELKSAWDSIFVNHMQKDPLPKVDFKTNEVYLIAMGEQTSGGYTIKVESVIETKKEVIINVIKSKPGKSCMTTSIMTYPYQLFMFSEKNKTVRFNWIDKIYECGKE